MGKEAEHPKSVNFSKRGKRHEDRFPNLTLDKKGNLWAAWTSFAHGKDEILARCWDGKSLSHPQIVSSSPGANYMPVLTCDSRGAVWIFWSSRRKGVWDVYGRLYEGKWIDEFKLTSGQTVDFMPSVCIDKEGKLWVAWVSSRDSKYQIYACYYDGKEWSKEENVSQNKDHNSRVSLTAGQDGSVWCIWDSYRKGNYDVWVREFLGGKLRSAKKVSQGDQWEFNPTIAVDKNGHIWAAWLSSKDVEKNGVIDQWPSIRCASYNGRKWVSCGDKNDEEAVGEVVDLCYGLLPKTSVWGYLGRRRCPMLAADDNGGIWLLWERKEQHDGHTGKTAGILCGKYFNGKSWSETLKLHQGKHYYVINSDISIIDTKLWFVANDASGENEGDICGEKIEILPLSEYSRIKDEPWEGWRLVHLRAKSRVKPAVKVDGEEYHLFWGDMHCHSALSADAEGELDELTFYARDKMALDFFAITDNDFYMRTLTASQWALIKTHASYSNQSDRFVIFSGYEMTYNLGQVNHRTVYYPTDDQPVIRFTDDNIQADLDKFGHELSKTKAIMHPHHAFWEIIDQQRDINAEVCSGWDIHIDRERNSVKEYLSKGGKIGFVGGSDSHRRNPGSGGALTGLFAANLSRESVFEALRARRCYATSGSKIFLDFRINGNIMGSEVKSKESPVIFVRILATTPVTTVQIYRNNQVIHIERGKGRRLEFEYADKSFRKGTSHYYVRVTQQGEIKKYPSNIATAYGNLAWSSPIWVTT